MPPQPAPNLFFFKEKTYFNLVNTYTSINVHTLHVFTKIRRRYWIDPHKKGIKEKAGESCFQSSTGILSKSESYYTMRSWREPSWVRGMAQICWSVYSSRQQCIIVCSAGDLQALGSQNFHKTMYHATETDMNQWGPSTWHQMHLTSVYLRRKILHRCSVHHWTKRKPTELDLKKVS